MEFGVWQERKSEEILVFSPLTSYLIPLFHLILRSRAWTRPWKEQKSGSGALRPSYSFRRFASRFLVQKSLKKRPPLSVHRPPRRALEAEKPSLVLRPRAWTRPWKEQESGSGALRPSYSFRRFASRFLVKDQREYEIKREGETSIENAR